MKWYSMGTDGVDFTSADRWYDWHKDNNILFVDTQLLWGGQKSSNNSLRKMHDTTLS